MVSTKASTTYLEVNSLDRNVSKHPNPGQYRIDLQDTIRNVEKLTLIGGTIPINNYNIYEFNKCFDISQGGTITTITLDEGIYDASGAASMIEGKLQAVDGTFSVVFNEITNKFTFSTDPSGLGYEFIFSNYPCATTIDSQSGAILNIPNASRILGFNPLEKATADGSNTLVSTFSIDLEPPERIYLYVNQMHTSDYSNIKQTRRKRQLYGIIYLGNSRNAKVQILNEETTRFFSQTYGGQDLRYMDIEFRDEFDNIYNFHNKQHTLLFRIDVGTPAIIPMGQKTKNYLPRQFEYNANI